MEICGMEIGNAMTCLRENFCSNLEEFLTISDNSQ